MVSANTSLGRNAVTAKVELLGLANGVSPPLQQFKVVITAVGCSPDGSIIAAAGSDLAVHVWTAATGAEICALHTDSEVLSLAFSPDGARLLAGTDDGSLMIWSLPGRAVRTIAEDQGQVNSVTFGASGRWLAAACRLPRCGRWPSGRVVASTRLSGEGRYSRVALSPKSGWLVGSVDGGVRDATTGHLMADVPGGSTMSGYGFAFSNDETLVAMASAGDVTVYSAERSNRVFSLPMEKWGSCAAFSPDNRLLAAGSGTMDIYAPGQLKVCELATRQTVFSGESLRLGVWGLAFSPDGTLLAAALGNYSDPAPMSVVWRFGKLRPGRRCWICAATVAACGRSRSVPLEIAWHQPHPIGVAGRSGTPVKPGNPANSTPEGEVIVWDVATGHELMRLRENQGGFFGVAFSPDGRRLATGQQVRQSDAAGWHAPCGDTDLLTLARWTLGSRHRDLSMIDETQGLGPSESSLDDLLAECIAAEESGRAIDRDALCRQHPQLAAELREFFANRDQMQRLAEPLQGGAAVGRAQRPSARQGPLLRRLRAAGRNRRRRHGRRL